MLETIGIIQSVANFRHYAGVRSVPKAKTVKPRPSVFRFLCRFLCFSSRFLCRSLRRYGRALCRPLFRPGFPSRSFFRRFGSSEKTEDHEDNDAQKKERKNMPHV